MYMYPCILETTSQAAFYRKSKRQTGFEETVYLKNLPGTSVWWPYQWCVLTPTIQSFSFVEKGLTFRLLCCNLHQSEHNSEGWLFIYWWTSTTRYEFCVVNDIHVARVDVLLLFDIEEASSSLRWPYPGLYLGAVLLQPVRWRMPPWPAGCQHFWTIPSLMFGSKLGDVAWSRHVLL